MSLQRRLTVLGFFCCVSILSAFERIAWSQEKPAVPAQAQIEINRLLDQGQEAYNREQYLQAEHLFLVALKKARAAGNKNLVWRLLNRLGLANFGLHKYNMSHDYYTQALNLYEQQKETGKKADIVLSFLHGGVGDACHELARSTGNKKQYESALYHLTLALNLTENFSNSPDIDNQRRILGLLDRLDDVHWHTGNYERALSYYHKALELRRKWGTKAQVAFSFERLGDIYLVLTRNDEALKYYNAACAVWQKVGDRNGIAGCLSGMGKAYVFLSQFQKAQETFTQALIYFPTSQPFDIAFCHLGRGGAFVGLGKYKEAKNDYIQALVLYQQLHKTVEIEGCKKSLAAIQLFTDGNKISSDALRVVNSPQVFHDQLSIALNLLTQGSLYCLQGHTQTAIPSLERALPLLQSLHATPYVTACANLLAEAYARQGQVSKALTTYQRAVDNYEAFSEQIGDPGQLGLLQASGPNLYAHYAQLLVQQKQDARALLIVERGRAQGLARQAAQNQVEYNPSILSRAETVELRKRNDALRSASEAYFGRHLRGAQARYEEAKRRRDLLNTVLYKRHAAYKRLRGAEPPTFARLQALARQHPDTLYLEWASVDEKTSLLFALSHLRGLQVFPLPYGSKTLFALMHKWRVFLAATGQLTNRNTPSDKYNTLWKAQEAEPQAATELYTLLFSRLENARMLSNARRLVVVADGPLLYLPFAALRDTRGKRLVERYALSSAISLGTLLWPPNPRQPKKPLLCLADPTGDTGQKVFAPTAGTTAGAFPYYNALPSARNYGPAIAALVPSALLYVGQKAQKATIMPQLPLCAVLLFATHGALNANNGLRSALILASAPPNHRSYNTLEAREIAGLQLSARLAILAACDSGLGQESGGEGLLGLAWAFRAAGCPCVTASQWSVDDAATGILMKSFCDGLKAHKRKDDALREAMLQVLHNSRYPRAYYWAAFQVIGDTSPISPGAITAR